MALLIEWISLSFKFKDILSDCEVNTCPHKEVAEADLGKLSGGLLNDAM